METQSWGGFSDDLRRASELFGAMDETNLRILLMLSASPLSTRELARRLGTAESHVSERIKRFANEGLVRSEGWVRLNGRNLKLYSATLRSIRVDFKPESFMLTLQRKGAAKDTNIFLAPYMRYDPPKLRYKVVGRRAERVVIGGSRGAVVVWGVAGIGKTSLVASWAARLRKNGTMVFWHTLRPGDSFTSVCTKLTQLFPEHKRSEVLEAMARCVEEGRFDGLIDEVIRLLGGFKGAIVFDDYHVCSG